MDKNNEWEWIEIPKGKRAAVAKYKDHQLPEYNSNPMIQALPPILSRAEFTKYVTRYPDFAPEEREFADCLTHLNQWKAAQGLQVKERIRVNQIWS